MAGPYPILRGALGDAYDALPAGVTAFHDIDDEEPLEASGRGDVHRGGGLTAALYRAVFRLPGKQTHAPVQVTISNERGSRRSGWRFESSTLNITMTQDAKGRVVLSSGIVTVRCDVAPARGGIGYRATAFRVLGIPVPRFLRPRLEAFESVENDVYTYELTVSRPGGARIARVRGWLMPRGVPVGEEEVEAALSARPPIQSQEQTPVSESQKAPRAAGPAEGTVPNRPEDRRRPPSA